MNTINNSSIQNPLVRKTEGFLFFVKACLLVAVMVTLMYTDPFGYYRKIIDILRLKFWIFTKEPKLLFYATIYIGSFFAKAIVIIIMVILMMSRRENLDEALSLRAPSSGAWKRFVMPFALFAIGMRIYYSFDPLIPNLPIRLIFPEAMLIGNTISVISVLIVAPISEELIFRGYIYNNFRNSIGSIPAILITSALFTLMHFPRFTFDPLFFVSIFLTGTIFGILREKTGSVLVPMLFHAIYNFGSIIVGTIIFFLVGY